MHAFSPGRSLRTLFPGRPGSAFGFRPEFPPVTGLDTFRRFEFTLPDVAPRTSAGVSDKEGRLVRTLWTVEPRPAGRHSVEWDGRDEFGNAAPGGTYSLRVVANGSIYTNVGTLGNTGSPPGER